MSGVRIAAGVLLIVVVGVVGGTLLGVFAREEVKAFTDYLLAKEVAGAAIGAGIGAGAAILSMRYTGQATIRASFHVADLNYTTGAIAELNRVAGQQEAAMFAIWKFGDGLPDTMGSVMEIQLAKKDAGKVIAALKELADHPLPALPKGLDIDNPDHDMGWAEPISGHIHNLRLAHLNLETSIEDVIDPYDEDGDGEAVDWDGIGELIENAAEFRSAMEKYEAALKEALVSSKVRRMQLEEYTTLRVQQLRSEL